MYPFGVPIDFPQVTDPEKHREKTLTRLYAYLFDIITSLSTCFDEHNIEFFGFSFAVFRRHLSTLHKSLGELYVQNYPYY